MLIGSSPPAATRRLDQVARLALAAEAVVLERHHHRDGVAVVDLRDVDVLRREPRHLERGLRRGLRHGLGQHRAQRHVVGRSGPGRSRGSRTGAFTPSSRARFSLITTTAAAPSETRQISSRRSGSTMNGDCMYLSSVSGTRSAACGFVGAVIAHRDRDLAELLRLGAVFGHVALHDHARSPPRR